MMYEDVNSPKLTNLSDILGVNSLSKNKPSSKFSKSLNFISIASNTVS